MKEENDARIAFLVALNKVQGVIEPAKKDSVNPHFKSRYASLAAVNEAVMGPLSEAGFVLQSGGIDIGGKPYLRTTLTHIKGFSESFTYPLIEKTDNPQHMASSFTYARRYSICALLNLSVEDDDAAAVSAAVKTGAAVVTEKPSSKVATAAGDLELVKFIPSKVTTRDGQGPKGPYTAYNVFDPSGKIYSTLYETTGQIAQAAAAEGKEVEICYAINGKFLNIKKLRLSEPLENDIEAPF